MSEINPNMTANRNDKKKKPCAVIFDIVYVMFNLSLIKGKIKALKP